jgi:large subunit ribosomal protein L13
MNTTKPTTAKDIVRKWHLIDVKGKVLGRAAVEIAHELMGKGKSYFVRNLDCGDYVVVVNAAHIDVTGNKKTEKTYYRHSGYPSGLKGESLKDLLVRRPDEAVIRAVKGMLPQNKLKATMLKRLFVFANETHTYEDKLKEKVK